MKANDDDITTDMSFANISGFKSKVLISDTVIKEYYNLDDVHWNRIHDAAIAFSVSSIGPKVLYMESFDGDDESPKKHIIEYERVNIIRRGDVLTQEKRDAIDSTIKLMHSLGYGHGDLHTGNIGFRRDTNQVCIIDHDTVFKIADGITPWLAKWMKKGFSWDRTFEEFIENDYDWVSDD